MAALMRHPPLIPPPVYERDPETSSIISSAPSYVSDRPPNYSRHEADAPSTNNTIASGPPSAAESATTLVNEPAAPVNETTSEPPVQLGLPPLRYAPGFTARSGTISEVEHHSYNISHWSNTTTSHAAKQYKNVAARRTSQASTAATLLSYTSPLSPYSSKSSTTSTTSAASASSTNLSPATSNTSATSSSTRAPSPPPQQPLNPLEDPALVGELAASRAKAQRLYREMCMRGEEGLRYESKSWDFMLAQMNDWEERGRSWNKFRNEMTAGNGRLGGKLLGRKIALGGLRQRI